MRRWALVALALAMALWGGVELVRADAGVLWRAACIAPDGSSWARELGSFTARVEQATQGRVRLKWYLSGIAGDEVETLDRMRRGQLAGAALSAGCDRVAPSLRVGRLPAMFQDRDEARDVMSRLQPTLAAEAHRAGLVLTGTGVLGADTIFTRVPVHSMAELRKLRIWHWDIDEVGIAGDRAMGLQIVPLPIWEAARAYDEGRVDGFFVVPTAALAYQFSIRARYLIDLRLGYIWGCPVFSERAFGLLSADDQAAIREAVAVLRERTDAEAREGDEALIGGLFKKQGVIPVPVSESFRAEFYASARAAREQIALRFLDKHLLDRVTQMLADYRGEHRER